MLIAKELRRRAWDSLRGKWDKAILITLLYSLIMSVGSVASLIVGGPLTLGLSAAMLCVMRGQSFGIERLFDGFSDSNFTRSLLLYLLNSIFVMLWSLLFFIPGIIKSLSYSMSFYILLDHPELTADEARKKSMELMHGHKWRLFCLRLSFIGWDLLCLLTFGILSLWVAPYEMAANAAFYRDLIGERQTEQPQVTVA